MTSSGLAKPGVEQHLFAGTVAGCGSTLAFYPLDLIKVRYQVHEGRGSAYSSISEAFRSIRGAEGWRGLYQGLAPAIIASAASWGGYFYFYENSKSRRAGPGDTLVSLDHLLAGVEAGSIMVFLTNPFWLIKTRLQIQGRDPASKKYKGFLDALATIVKEEGLLGLYKGIVPALLLTSHGAIQFTVYEYLKTWSAQFRTEAQPNSQPPIVSVVIGGVSKIAAATVTYPYQVVKARLQQREALPAEESLALRRKTKPKYSGTIDCLWKIYKNEGIPGYFKGVVPNVLRVAPSAALTLVLYEECLKLQQSQQL